MSMNNYSDPTMDQELKYVRHNQYNEMKCMDLLSAVKYGNLELARQLLYQGVNPNIREYWGRRKSCLQYATEQKNKDLVRVLLFAGADPNEVTLKIVREENMELLELILRSIHNARFRLDTVVYREAIFKSIDLQRKDLVELLLNFDGYSHIANQSKGIILHYAVKSRIYNTNSNTELYLDILKLLLDHNASMDYRLDSTEESNPAQTVLEFGSQDVICLFLNYGFKFDGREIQNPLHCAVKNENYVLEYLLEHLHFDIDDIDSMHYSVLHEAVRYNKVNIVETLLQYKANLEIPDTSNVTPLITAVDHNYLECARLLLEHGANVNHIKANGENSWYFAARQNRSECFELLLTYGADIKFDEWIFDDVLYSINFETINVLLRHIALLESQQREVNPDYYKLMVERDLLNKNNLGLDYLNDCQIEVGLLQTSVIDDTTTFHDILIGKIPDHLFTDTQFIEIFKTESLMNMFPIFGKQLCDIFHHTKSKRDLEIGMIRGLNRILRFDVKSFYLIGENILRRLYNRDLRNLCRV